jgi:uncharacterized iron-regulated membrane protein
MSFLDRPQQTRGRRVLFQVHVWTGLVVGLYAIFIGVTGSALVFRSTLQQRTYPALFASRRAGTALAPAETVIASLTRQFPGYRFSGFEYPSSRRGSFLAYLANGDELHTVFLDAERGTVIGELPRDGWIQRLQDLHFTFLAGPRGYVLNGIAAACLLVMCLTGVVVWWPGLSRMAQACIVHPGRGWRRIVWELHGAAAIWSVALLIVWCVSGIYFSFPGPFRQATERVVTLAPYPSLQSQPPTSAPPPAPSDLVRTAQSRVPGAQLARFSLPSGQRGTYSVTLARDRHGDGDTSDEVTVYFDRFTGRELATRDQTGRTAGDIFLIWLGRLHVGNFGGTAVKLVWFTGGLVFPLLAVTGAVMWWNRFVRPKLRASNGVNGARVA